MLLKINIVAFFLGDTNIAICCGNKIYCNEGQDPLHEAFHNNCEYLHQIPITSTQVIFITSNTNKKVVL
jgi:hypothetical protein